MDLFNALGSAAAANLLTPAILFFSLGMLAGFLRSDLTVPEQVAKTLALYLMLCIGFKGGVEANKAGLSAELLSSGALGLALSFLTPFAAFALLRMISRLDKSSAAAVAAHYGSVSVVTFAAGSEYLRGIGVEFSGHMAAVLALMETPAILAALLIAGGAATPSGGRHRRGALLREVLLNGAAVLLIGSFIIGAITGERGLERLELFVNPLFQGVLCLFLLDMGLVASRQIAASPKLQPSLVVFALLWPLLAAAVAVLASVQLGLSTGDATLMAVLAASASYIAAPAAMRIALPQADAGVYLTMSLAVTFPFNLLVGIPLYQAAAAFFVS
ncbi:MAG: sodium-dependent bicarbonate transport family permease [Hyphomonadaceae bacterium]|nr:sodium-dependent bicarbonate transport family permease [Hyphomonadaceae bacterium]